MREIYPTAFCHKAYNVCNFHKTEILINLKYNFSHGKKAAHPHRPNKR